MTTLHILSSPYSPVNINNRIDPFSIAVVKFIDQMTRHGWNCVHYGIPDSAVNCELVQCVEVICADNAINIYEYNDRAGSAIAERKQSGDIIVCFHGIENKVAAQANPDLKTVEPSIGYMTSAVFAEYRVFVSYAQMHMYYGQNHMLMTPSWWDAVIPNAITESEFTYSAVKQDYFLYFGRVIENKGVHLAIQATKAAGKQLIIAGPGSLLDMGYTEIPDHVKIAGLCNAEQRRVLMMNAKAVIGPTYYVEPFGNMVAEAYMSGTPAITSDWGGFAETVVQGVTGFRCRSFKDFVEAINNIDSIDPAACRAWAMKNYDDIVVHNQLHDYFKKISEKDFYKL